ncbi:MAG: glycoside hydrolase family 28 protein [Bacteroidota bacterium]
MHHTSFSTKIIMLLFLCFSCSPSTKTTTEDFTLAKAKQQEQRAWEKEATAIVARIKAPTFPDREIQLKLEEKSNDIREIVQTAIDEMSQKGGGKVILPEGKWFSKGPIHLKSNVNLHLEEGAILQFSDEAEDYLPLVKVRWEGTVCWNYSPLIYAFQQENMALTGRGVIDGNGREWSMDWRKKQKPDKKVLRQMGNDLVPEDQRVFGNGFLDLDGDGKDDGFGDGQEHWLRPTLVELYECKNILIQDLTVKNSPFWTIHPVFSQNVTIRNLDIFGGYLNDDGIDPDSCEDVLIEDCYIETEDDAIAIKAGRDQDAWERAPCQNVVVRNCKLNSGVNSFCVGSEMSGGVENVFVENCHIIAGKHALNFKCNLDRGGKVQNIYLRNIEIDTIQEAMFIFRMDYHGYRGNNYPTEFTNFYASNIRCKKIEGLPFKIVGVEAQPISNVLLHTISVAAAEEESVFEYADDIILERVQINGAPLTAD